MEACVVWCQKKNGSTKSRGWTFPDGTVCQTRRTRYGKPTYCINGRCEVILIPRNIGVVYTYFRVSSKNDTSLFIYAEGLHGSGFNV